LTARAPLIVVARCRAGRSLALAAIAGALFAAPAGAQPHAVQPEYFRAYGVVAGQVNAVETVHALCVERYPETAPAQRGAMSAWRARHQDLLRLLDAQPGVMAADNAVLPAAERIDVQRIVDGRDRMREQTRRSLAQDPERLQAACAQYLAALDTPGMALETVHAAEIESIHRGPLGDRVRDPVAACPGPELGPGCGPSVVDRAQRGAETPRPPPAAASAPASAPR
jgi:hypothetical protein